MATTEQQTAAEWAASLTAQQVMDMVSGALRRRDMKAAAAAIQILAVKDPSAAETVLAALEARAAEDDEGTT